MAHLSETSPPQELVNLVLQIVGESGCTEGFNAQAWLQGWLAAPLPAFGNRRPGDLLQEPGGLALVQSTLLQIQSGSYA
ncbi:MbcA/ParS/Xre antitoxin family protein [Acidovorax sp. 56]|uniref:MbcA/ParS/Xre antitoxin family protein n=1 Tax=Acidovorax sp. 56 TaxID=2035205 RepID=UPI000C17262C|nr:MbcA/ParS/Xre antitoxin family protein [Acidovorax sp. 56]